MDREIRKYNPGFLTDRELVDSFCVRAGEFALLVEALRESTGNSNPHTIVIGPRGSGKTTLLLRVAAEARRDPILRAAWFPVVFPEESYEVSTCGEFWLQCLRNLAEQSTRAETDPDLERAYEELRTVQDDRVLADSCLAVILDFAACQEKRLVLLVENLNTLFNDIGNPEVGWQLRKTLQCEPRIFLMGSATSRFDEIDNPERAFYELFQVQALKRLDTESCAILWRNVSNRDIDTPVIRSLEILTGGNPRLVAIVAKFGSQMAFHQLMSNLLNLIDDHTEYFRSHLEALGVQDRRVYLALARLWKPASAKDVSAISRLGTSHCSAILKRLVDRGAVICAGGTARRREYYLAERMYNIYYLLRQGRGMNRVVEALVQFMVAFYSPSELVGLRERIIAATRVAEGTTLATMKQALQLLPTSAKSAVGQAQGACRESGNPSCPRESTAGELAAKAAQLLKDRQHDRAIAVCEEMLTLLVGLETPNAVRHRASALAGKSVALTRTGRTEEALSACDEVLRLDDAFDVPGISKAVADALVNKIELLGGLGCVEELVAASETFADRFDSAGSVATERQRSAVLFNKGVALAELQRSGAALEVLEEVLERFGASGAEEVQEPVVRALVARSGLLEESGRTEDACRGYDDVVARFGSHPTPEVADPVATAILRKGMALAEQGRYQDALTCFEDVPKRFEAYGTPEMDSHLAMAFNNRGVMLEHLDRPREALEAYDATIRKFSSHDSPDMEEHLANAYANRCISLLRAERLEQGFAAIDDFGDRFSGSPSAAIRHLVGRALLEKAKAELRTGQPATAVLTAGRALKALPAAAADSLVLSHLLRAEGHFACRNHFDCESELASMLELLSRHEIIPETSIEGLMAFTIRFGPKRVLALIEASPAVKSLFPLVTALREEIGVRTRVAREVAEVAKDIRLNLTRLKQAG